jgi:hypothetical protein
MLLNLALVHANLHVRHTHQCVDRRIAQVSLNLSVVRVDKVLNNLERTIFQFCSFIWPNLSDLREQVVLEILTPDLLKKLPWHFNA